MSSERRALPLGWQTVRLGEAGEIGSGITLGKLYLDEQTRRVPYLRVANVKDGYLDLTDVSEIDVPEREIEKCRLKFGDLLLTEGGDPDKLGRGTYWEAQIPECIHQNHVFRVRLDMQMVIPQYAAAQLGSPYGKSYFLRYSKQTTGIATINQRVLSNFPLIVPPLVEQLAIVRRLERDMAEVERLRAACELQSQAVASLPVAYLRQIFECEAAEGWEERRLGDILRLRKDVIHPSNHPAGAATFVGLEHVESHTGIRIGSLAVEMSQLTGRKPQFRQGDIVYGYLRPYLNKVWVAEFDGLCSVDQYVYAVEPDSADVRYVAAFLRSPLYLERAPIRATPGQLPRIRTEEVAAVKIALPPLDHQQQVVQHLEAQAREINHLQRHVERQRAAIEVLPGSLLSEVFGGAAS
jgi:type I restriction enzyme, S subunit